jgi:hypothetical protein
MPSGAGLRGGKLRIMDGGGQPFFRAKISGSCFAVHFIYDDNSGELRTTADLLPVASEAAVPKSLFCVLCVAVGIVPPSGAVRFCPLFSAFVVVQQINGDNCAMAQSSGSARRST